MWLDVMLYHTKQCLLWCSIEKCDAAVGWRRVPSWIAQFRRKTYSNCPSLPTITFNTWILSFCARQWGKLSLVWELSGECSSPLLSKYGVIKMPLLYIGLCLDIVSVDLFVNVCKFIKLFFIKINYLFLERWSSLYLCSPGNWHTGTQSLHNRSLNKWKIGRHVESWIQSEKRKTCNCFVISLQTPIKKAPFVWFSLFFPMSPLKVSLFLLLFSYNILSIFLNRSHAPKM